MAYFDVSRRRRRDPRQEVETRRAAIDAELIRIFGKQGWGYDPAAISPNLHLPGQEGRRDTCRVCRADPQAGQGFGAHRDGRDGPLRQKLKAEEIILALVQKKSITAMTWPRWLRRGVTRLERQTRSSRRRVDGVEDDAYDSTVGREVDVHAWPTRRA